MSSSVILIALLKSYYRFVFLLMLIRHYFQLFVLNQANERRNMFTLQQLNTIDRVYFHVFEASPLSVTLKSKNTRHFWKVNIEGNKTVLYHSHQGDGNYHVQCMVKGLDSAIKKVKEHDHFQLRHRKKEDNDYDYIPLLTDSDYFVF